MKEYEKESTKKERAEVRRLLSQSPMSIYDLAMKIDGKVNIGDKVDVGTYNRVKYYLSKMVLEGRAKVTKEDGAKVKISVFRLVGSNG